VNLPPDYTPGSIQLALLRLREHRARSRELLALAADMLERDPSASDLVLWIDLHLAERK
jgi:hypothetical protein